jgi:hypothetical protein
MYHHHRTLVPVLLSLSQCTNSLLFVCIFPLYLVLVCTKVYRTVSVNAIPFAIGTSIWHYRFCWNVITCATLF